MQRLILIGFITFYIVFNSGTVHSQTDSTGYGEIDTALFIQPELPDHIKKNTIYAEIGGNGILYSINFDRLVDLSPKFKLATRIGIQYTNKFPLQYYRTLCVPIEISGLFSIYGKKHFVEIGSGLSYLNNYYRVNGHTEDILIVALRLGYRFQQPEGGLFVKIGFVPLYDWLVFNPDPAVPHHRWLFSGGIGIGHTF